MYCGHCGAAVRPENRFCTQCGLAVGRPCPACGHLGAWGDRFCGACGNAVVPGAVRGQPAQLPVQALQTQPYAVPVAYQVPQPALSSPAEAPLAAAPAPAAVGFPAVHPGPEEAVNMDALRTEELHRRLSPEVVARAQAEWLAASEGERRAATIMFADISGSTAISEGYDHEDISAVMNEVYDLFAKVVVDDYGGWLVKTVGDAVLAAFGAPIALEDAPERAVRAALDVQKAMSTFAPKSIDLKGRKLGVRIGITTGEVSAGGVLADGTRRFDVMGFPVALAQRLESAAPVGGVLVSQAVRDRLGESVDFEATEPLTLKNVKEPVQAYLVKGLRRREARLERSARLGLTRMIGRARQQRVLRDVLDVAASGRGQVVAVTGEVGVGKSRLILETHEYARQKGMRVLSGACLSFGYNVVYLPLRDIVKRAANIDDLEPEGVQRAKLLGLLDRLGGNCPALAPALGAIIDLPYQQAGLEGLPDDTRTSIRRGAIRDAFTQFVLALSDEQPLMLVVDDLQWIDSVSTEVLQSLVESIGDRRIALVFAHRLDYAPFWREGPNVTTIELARLSPEESQELLSDRLQGISLPPRVRDEVILRAAGTPYFLEEILRSLIASGKLESDPESITLEDVPATVYELVMARIDKLSEQSRDCRPILQLCSVIRPPIRQKLIEAVAGAQYDVPRAMADLERLRFLRRRKPSVDTDPEYEFEHQLTQDVAYNAIPRRRRLENHRRVAAAMEELYASRLRSQAHMIAHHYAEAGLPQLALQYVYVSINKALVDGAHPELLDLAHRGIEMVRPLSDDPAYKAIMAQLYIERSAGLARVGKANLAMDDCHRGLELALAARALDVEALGLEKLAYVHGVLGDFSRAGQYYKLSISLFELIGDENYVSTARLGAAAVLHDMGAYEQARDMYRGIVEFERRQSRRKTNRRGELAALLSLAGVLEKLDQYDEALEYTREALELREQVDDPVAILYARGNEGLISFALGRHQHALRVLSEVLDEFRERQLRPMVADVLKDVARCHLEMAHYDYALAAAREAREIAIEVQAPAVEAEALLVEAEVHNRLGAAEMAEELANRALTQARALLHPGLQSYCYRTLAYAAHQQGDHPAALDRFRLAVNLALETQSRKAQVSAMVGLGFARLSAGEPDLAATTLEEALALADSIRARLRRAEAHLGLGRAYEALGRNDESLEHYRSAAEVAAEIDHPETLWRARAGLARAQRRLQQYQDALAGYVKAIGTLKRILQNAAADVVRGPVPDSAIELQAEATAMLFEMGAVATPPAGHPAEVVALVRSRPAIGVLREHSPAVESLFEQLLLESRIQLRDDATRN